MNLGIIDICIQKITMISLLHIDFSKITPILISNASIFIMYMQILELFQLKLFKAKLSIITYIKHNNIQLRNDF